MPIFNDGFVAVWGMVIYMSVIYLPVIPHPELFIPILIFCICMGLGLILEMYMKKRWDRPTILLNFGLPIIAMGLLALRFGLGIESIKGFIFLLLLLFAANSDIQTREVDDYIPVMICVTALIGIGMNELPLMLISALIITAPQLIVVMLRPNKHGGADIKLMAASAFLLGLERGLTAIIVGLSLAVITKVIIQKIEKKNVNESFALVPYLAVGSFLAFLI